MKPSPAFDMLTRETVFQEVGRVMGGWGLQVRSPSLPSSLPIIFCLFAISPLACFFHFSALTDSQIQTKGL